MTFHVPEDYRVTYGRFASDASYKNNGIFCIRGDKKEFLHVIASDGLGWDHVSVSREDRIPNWREMCLVKKMFWEAEDCVIQFHPPESQYVNNHPYVLHLWRPQSEKIPMPPLECV